MVEGFKALVLDLLQNPAGFQAVLYLRTWYVLSWHPLQASTKRSALQAFENEIGMRSLDFCVVKRDELLRFPLGNTDLK